jgi:hypothetical protein
MKRTIGLVALMLTAVAAFAAPAAAWDRNDYNRKPVVVEQYRNDYNRKPVVVVRDRFDYNRRPVVVVRHDEHRGVRVSNLRQDSYRR